MARAHPILVGIFLGLPVVTPASTTNDLRLRFGPSMAQTSVSEGTTTAASLKRGISQEPEQPRKRIRKSPPPQPAAMPETPSTAPLSGVHEKILEELQAKYDVLSAFTISSTKIAKRDARILEHLRKDNGDPRPRVVFLHARPSDVNKMITITEQVKREIAQQGKNGGNGRWFQYNMLYELPPSLGHKKTKSRAGSEDAVQNEDPSSDETDEFFEVMESRNRLDEAIAPRPAQRVHMSLSIFLAQAQIPELKGRTDITTQTNKLETEA